jgi:S1-C subfamily serine protease
VRRVGAISQEALSAVAGGTCRLGRMSEHTWPEAAGPPGNIGAAVPEPPPLQPMPAPPAPNATRAGKRLLALSMLFLTGAGTGSGVAVGVLLARQSSTSATQRTGGSSGPSTSLQPPFDGGGTTPSPSGDDASAAAIAAKVDPTVVDINATLATGGEVAGTGIVITSTGEVLTNNHVIANTSRIVVQVDGSGPRYSATVLGTDAADDIALLKIQGASNLKTAAIGDSETATVGETVAAVGNALGRGGTPAVSLGSITALDRTITAGDSPSTAETLKGTIQIDAFIQPGDSGGPLVDSAAKVIGIDTAAQSMGGEADAGSNVGFAIPINTAMTIVHQIEAGRTSANIQIGTRGVLGVAVRDSAGAGGALVEQVETGSAAAQAGITAGALITAVDGSRVASPAALQAALHGKHPGDRVAVSWTAPSGQSHSATMQLEAGPPA